MIKLALCTSLALLTPLAPAQIDWELEGARLHFETGSSSAVITDAETAPDGSVYICGRRNLPVPFINPVRALIARVDGITGEPLWEREIETGDDFIAAVDVVAQADGGAIVVAVEVIGGSDPARLTVVTRYDATGVRLWQTRLTRTPPGVGPYSTVAHSACADGQGGVLIAGFEAIPGLHPMRATIFRVNGAGVELPSAAPFGNTRPEIYGITPATSGGVYVALGSLDGNLAARLDAAFTPIWTTTLTVPGAPLASPIFHRSITEDEFGNVFGVLSGTGFNPATELVRLDPASGAVVWSMSPLPDAPGATAPVRGRAPRVVARSGGGVWLAGEFAFDGPGGTTAIDATFARSVEPDGTPRETWQYELQGPGVLSTVGAVVSADGHAYVFGRTNAAKFGATPIPGASGPPAVGVLLRLETRDEIGVPYCTPAFTNSTGQNGQIAAAGSALALDDDVVLRAFDLPPQVTALMVSGSQQGVTPLLGGSQGVLCIAGNLGRFSDSIGTTSPTGLFRYRIDTQDIPTALGPIAATAGLTYQFQCWHRDTTPGGSNTTNAVTLTFE